MSLKQEKKKYIEIVPVRLCTNLLNKIYHNQTSEVVQAENSQYAIIPAHYVMSSIWQVARKKI